ncbi:MAG: amidohydrolase family protein [Porticoccaceae bacterium]|jgi:imidazolonepropionase-like amidohydrolase|nr:amidohydrolase family protein [Porticoccaceae bacterium]
MKYTVTLLVLTLVSTLATASSILIKDADIYASSGLLVKTNLYIENGKIAAIGAQSPATADLEIQGLGKSITAGLFNSSTHLGTVEVSAIEQTVDFYSENETVTASLRIADAFNPRSTLIPHNRVHGLTHSLLVPESGTHLFSGQVALVQLGNQPKVIHPSLAVALDFTERGISLMGGSRAAALVQLRQALDDAKDFSRNRKAALAGDHRDYVLSYADLAALEPVVNGTKPLLVQTNRASDISIILDLAKNFQLQLILSSALEGWMVADEIARAQVPVIIDPIHNLPNSYESLGARLDNAKLLADAGVKLLFTGMDWHNTHSSYLVRQSAGNAVANGLDKSIAIAAMTTNPAQLFNAPVTGDIAIGDIADLVLWGGDPLELTSEAELVMIEGEIIPMESRALQLRARYFDRLKQ